MKLFTIIFVLVLNTLFADTCSKYEVTSLTLNIREGSSITSPVIDKLNKGDTVCITNFSDMWAELNRGGWVSHEFLIPLNEVVEQSKTSIPKKSESSTFNVVTYTILSVIVLFMFYLIITYLETIIMFIFSTIIIGIFLGAFYINIWFGLGLIILLFVISSMLQCDGKHCPKCKKCVDEYSSENLIEEHYKHATKSGDADKRYKKNPLMQTYEYIYECKNEECNHVFSIQKIKKN